MITGVRSRMRRQATKQTRLLPTLLVCISISLLPGCASIVGLFSGEQPISENPGKRTLGSFVDDEIIETKTLVNIRKAAPGFADGNVNVTSFNGVVLLAGQVRSESLRKLAGEVAAQVRNVRRVHNELQVAGVTSGLARSNDAWLTSKVKTRMFANSDVDASRIKVVTENGTVFLMGLVTATEAEKAVEAVRRVRGVEKIVKIFEYIG